MKNSYKINRIMIFLAIIFIVIYLHLTSHKKAGKIYVEQIEKSVITMERNFLYDTVNNVFTEIDKLREKKEIQYSSNSEARLKRFEEEKDLSDEEFINFYKNRFEDDINYNMWTAILWDEDRGDVIYKTKNLDGYDKDNIRQELISRLSSIMKVEKGSIRGYFGVERSYVDEKVKEEIGDLLRLRRFANDSYIWINEIINYEGGKNYAIRRVHPNLENTEGSYLSTETEDIKGNHPYLDELEGINKHGEVYLSYYFKELNSLNISRKISYGKLYKDYNWVISMGVHLNQIDEYIDKLNDETNLLVKNSIILILRYLTFALFIGFGLVYLMERRNLSTSTEVLERQINIDSLTSVSSRAHGEKNLEQFFKHFKVRGKAPIIMLFDIDKFKLINDKFGHETGDIVLWEVAHVIKESIRSTDVFIRWGGDEFVGIFPGAKEENIRDLGEKLINEVNKLRIPYEDEIITVSISIGFSQFKEEDVDYNDALRRADRAMYISKNDPKSKLTFLP